MDNLNFIENMNKCSTPNCGQPIFADGLCADCYNEANPGGKEKFVAKSHAETGGSGKKPRYENEGDRFKL